MTLKEYMQKTAEIYKEYAPEYIKSVKAEQAAREEIYKARSSRDLTPDGKQKRIAALQELCNEHKANMAALARTAKDKAQEVRHEVEQRFYSRFHARPDALDMQALELLKSGILTDSELIHLAETYNGNNTMGRICGKYLEQSKSPEAQHLGRALQLQSLDPHLQAIDAIIQTGEYTMGGAPLSGSRGAENMLSRFDEMTAQIFRNAPDVSEEE